MLWVPGQKLKARPYKIETIIGQGGFGITYKATHLYLNHSVVLKTPNAGLQADPDYPKFVDRFIKEGQILAKISQNSHPNIVRVSDLFVENNIPCLVMDLVSGNSLLEIVQQRGALPESEAVEYIRQIGDALVMVHKEGIVHRDVHPGNIIIDKNRAVLIDFGIAGEIIPSVMSSKHPHNPAFAPWEQHIEGSRDVRVDVYTLAASLYYIVTGQVPASSLKRKFQNHVLLPPKNVSDRLRQAILKGMEIEAENRPQSMQKWLDLFASIYVDVELRSVKGIDYRNLEKLLAAGKWQEADKETANKMLKVMGRQEEGWLNEEHIDNFPCEDLRTIDQLWVKYSNNRFGFSVQKRIYQSLGGTREYDEKIWQAFGNKVGWRKNDKWLYYSEVIFNTSAPYGHLPTRAGEALRSLLSRRDL